MSRHSVTITVNGARRQAEVESRELLVHFADTGPATRFALAGSQAHGNGVLHLTYTLAAPGHE